MAQERKRPWYLVVALSGALALGMMGGYSGCANFTLYRAPEAAVAARVAETHGIADEADRAAVQARFDAYIDTLDAAKPRGWPLAVATLLLGSAIVFFGMRTIGGSSSGRVALVQLVFVQAGVTAAGAWLMRDVDEAELRFELAKQSAHVRESNLEKGDADQMMRMWERVSHAIIPVQLALRTLGSALVIVALTRRRSREFFDAASAAIEER
jgi:hypothetical protein